MEPFYLSALPLQLPYGLYEKNKKLKNTYGLHRDNKTFSEECIRLLKYEKYECYKLTGMKYKCLKQAGYGIHHGYVIAERNNQYDNAIIIKEERQWENYSLRGK